MVKLHRRSLAVFAAAVPLSLCLSQPGRAASRGHQRTRPAASASAALHAVSLPDGSGTIRLPAGWRVTGAHQGMISAEGPQGGLDFGLYATVYTPQWGSPYGVRPPLVASYGDPAHAAQELMPQFSALASRAGGPAMRWGRLIEQAPATWAQGRGAFIHYEWVRGGSQRWQSVAVVLLSPSGDGTFTYYTSIISAPSTRFRQSLPTLLRIWQSWKTDDRVFQQRLTHAMESMRQCAEIIQGVNARRQTAQTRSNAAWDHVIRETAPMEDTRTGKRIDVPNDQIRRRIDELNRREGYTRYREVPFDELDR